MQPTTLHSVFAGILFILDPHVSSRKPGTRNDIDFTATVIDKIDQAACIANERNLVPVIPGDLFDREHDTQDLMMTLLVRALNKFQVKPFVLAGNHDLTETSLTDDTALAVLKEAGVVRVVDQNGLFLACQVKSGDSVKAIAVGGTPHGMQIPDDVRYAAEDAGIQADVTGWITHEDLAFDGAYPGALEMFQIKGCPWVVNGHMHLTKEPVRKGGTLWHNPGNITRLSKDCAAHTPSVWAMDAEGIMTQIPLRFVPDVFDAVKGRVQSDSNGASTDSASAFVDMLKACTITSKADIRTEDGSLLMHDIAEVCKERKTSLGTVNILTALHGMAVE